MREDRHFNRSSFILCLLQHLHGFEATRVDEVGEVGVAVDEHRHIIFLQQFEILLMWEHSLVGNPFLCVDFNYQSIIHNGFKQVGRQFVVPRFVVDAGMEQAAVVPDFVEMPYDVETTFLHHVG